MINNLKQLNELRKAMGSLKDLNIDDNLEILLQCYKI